jgi:intraflagellar transport protein 74
MCALFFVVGGGMRPGTGSQGAPAFRPGTGQRMATGSQQRLGTGQQAAQGMSIQKDVSISDRPVTQQGMMGIRQATAGPGRQVQDASFFVSLLRTKISECSAECTKMRSDIERIGKDSSLMTQLERKYEGLIKEVRELEGSLADYNLAMDKSRTSTDPSEITQYFAALKRRNEQASRDVDAVFMERQERDRGAQRLQDQVNQSAA